MAIQIEVADGNYVYVGNKITGEESFKEWAELSEEAKGKWEDTLSELMYS